MFSPAGSLAALRTFDRELFLRNACAKVPASCVWIQKDTRLTARDVESRFAINVVEGGPLEQISDSYVCMGAASLGSGRSVFVDGMQIKGVGRTAHAPPKRHARVTDGWFAMDRAIREIHGAAIVRRLSSIPQLPLAFAMVLPRGDETSDRVLLGRRGTPIRVGHLDYLRGASYIHPLYLRMSRWRRFINRLVGKSGFGLEVDDVHAVFDAIVDRALLAIAEARLFGLTFANWHDNADLFARAFDCEDVEFHFGTPLRPRAPRLGDGETAHTYFTRTLWASVANTRHDVYACSLQYLQNAFVALDHLAAGLTYDPQMLDARYGWARLRTGYRAALARVLARWLAVPDAAARSTATRLAELVPLVATAPSASFSPRELVEGVRNGGGVGPARALGARLASKTTLSSAALDAMMASLSGRRIAAERAELVAEATTIAGAAKPGRVAAYRKLFRRAESAASAVRVGRD